MDRFPSILLSLILHLALFALVLFWPEPSPPPLLQGGRIVQGYVTLGKEGTTATDVKPSEARPGVPAEQPQPEAPRPPVQEQPPAVEPQPEPPKETPAEQPVPEEPPKVEEQPKPEPQPQGPPKVTEPPQAKPEPPKEPEPDAVQVAEKREPEKKEAPRQNATARVEPTKNATAPVKNATAQKQQPTKNATARKEPPKKGDPIKDALKDIAKNTPKNRPGSGGSGSGDALKDALADLKKQAGGTGGDASGYGPGGRGGTGIGAVTQAYMEVVASAIKRNWSLAGRADRKDLYATVRIHLSVDGVIEQYEMVRPSGDRVFDSTLITAIVSTAMVPEAPPTAQDRVIDVNFYP